MCVMCVFVSVRVYYLLLLYPEEGYYHCRVCGLWARKRGKERQNWKSRSNFQRGLPNLCEIMAAMKTPLIIPHGPIAGLDDTVVSTSFGSSTHVGAYALMARVRGRERVRVRGSVGNPVRGNSPVRG
jgi:hypothetical protein